MARHPRPLSRITSHHRHHPWFMTYAYCSTGAALWTVITVWRVIA